MKELPFKEVESIQSICATAMDLWGYNRANNEEEYKDLKPLKIFELHSDNNLLENQK